MTDKGTLSLPADADLSALVEKDDGYSLVVRGTVPLYPVANEKNVLFFSRAPLGNKAPGNRSALVDFPS